jgi:hypothetical protein
MATERIPNGVAIRVVLKAFLSSDHVSAATGKTLAVKVSKNGAAFADPNAGATNATEIGSGWYYVDLNTTDTGTNGPLLVRATAATVDDIEPPPFLVVSAHNAGFDSLPDVTAAAAGGVPLLDGSAHLLVYSVSQGVTVTTNNDKTGYSLTQTFPTNFSALSITNNGVVDANWARVLGTTLTEGAAGRLKAAITTFFDVAAPVLTTASVNQTGDNFARIGATGSGLTSLAPASTALSTAQWTNARAGYVDNLNVGGAVASHADVLAVNQSASKHVLLVTVGQYERPESGTVTYTVEARTFSAADGSSVNADSTPTLTALGNTTGDLSAKLSAATNPATGVYRWTYTVSNTDTQEQVRFDLSAVIAAATFTLSTYTQVVDLVSATWTSNDRGMLTAVYNVRPANTPSVDVTGRVTVGTNNDKTGYSVAGTKTTLDALNDLNAAAVRTAVGLATANLDGQLNLLDQDVISRASSTVAPTWYSAPPSVAALALETSVQAVKAKTDNLPADPVGLANLAAAHGTGSYVDSGAAPSVGTIVAAVFSQLIESGVTFAQLCEAVGAALAGTTTGGGLVYAAVGNPGTTRLTVAVSGSDRTVTTNL